MKTLFSILFSIMLFSAGTPGSAFDAKQPAVISQGTGTTTAQPEEQLMLRVSLWSSRFSQFPIALVNNEPITLEDLTNALSVSHGDRTETGEQTGKMDYMKILERLINVKLAVQEAVAIGLDEQPEFIAEQDKFVRATYKALLADDIAKDIKTDPAEVEKLYVDVTTEWKIKSVLFDKEDDAKSMVDGLKAGGSFDELAEQAVNEKKARSGDQGEYLKPSELLPAMVKVIAAMEVGSISPVIPLEPGTNYTGFAIIRLEDVRHPDNDAAREWAERTVRARNREKANSEHMQELHKKQVEINDRVIDRLDYDSAKTKLDELLTDTRIVAEIEEEKPISVGDLTAALNAKHYHGLQTAAEAKKLNRSKRPVLNELIDTVLINKEALKRGIDKSVEYQNRLKDFRTNTLFGLFIDRVVFPDFKLYEDDVKAYYENNKKKFLSQEQIRMTGIVFEKKHHAESALQSLKRGADIKWVRANADGITAETEKDSHFLGGNVVAAMNHLPEDLQKVLARARAGDSRLYAGPDGHFYVLFIEEIVPPQQMPFEEVRESIRKELFSEKLNESVEEWFLKLRAAGEIKVYLVAGTE